MGKEKLFLSNQEPPKSRSSTMHNIKRLLKLAFGSYSVIIVSLNIISLSVTKGDAFADFTGGLITDLGPFLELLGGAGSYIISLLASAIIFLGPLSMYAQMSRIDIVIILLITFFLTGFFLGKMFKHPFWAFLSGIAVMLSFVITLMVLMSFGDTFTEGLGIPISINGIIDGAIAGLYGMDTSILYPTSVLLNGSVLGLFSAFWGTVLMPKKQKDHLNVSFKCDEGDLCKI